MPVKEEKLNLFQSTRERYWQVYDKFHQAVEEGIKDIGPLYVEEKEAYDAYKKATADYVTALMGERNAS